MSPRIRMNRRNRSASLLGAVAAVLVLAKATSAFSYAVRVSQRQVMLSSTATPSVETGEVQASTTSPSEGVLVPSSLPSIANHILHHSQRIDELYDKSSTIRCPFLRRRAADVIDGVAMILRFLVIRHKSLGVFDPLKSLPLLDDEVDATARTNAEDSVVELLRSMVRPPGSKAIGKHGKNPNLPLTTIASTIQRDWECGPSHSKGYYLTGRLNSTIYRDDCLFEGPDPDMPVKGLRKYLSAASHLFERESSFAKMLDLTLEEGGGRHGRGAVLVRWRLGGRLMLPWRPTVRPWTGSTRYHLDGEGLIYLHEEMWDISVAEAFVCTVLPRLGERIWGAAAPIEEGEVISAMY